MHKQVAVWIDHQEARVLHIPPKQMDEAIVAALVHRIHHRSRKGPSSADEHPGDRKRFFHRVERSVKGAKQILLLGPSTPKLDFARYLRKYDRSLERRIVGIETVAEPTDAQLTPFTKAYFPVARAS